MIYVYSGKCKGHIIIIDVPTYYTSDATLPLAKQSKETQVVLKRNWKLWKVWVKVNLSFSLFSFFLPPYNMYVSYICEDIFYI